MSVVVACPTCQAKLRAPEDLLGRPVRCSQCKRAFTPAPAAAAAEGPAALAGAAPDLAPPPRPEILPEVAPAARPPRAAMPAGDVREFLLFRRMVAPSLIVVLFYVGAVLQLLAGVVAFVAGFVSLFDRRGGPAGLAVMAGAVIATPLAILLWRVYCEVLIVLFRILEQLQTLNERKGDQG
jgi:hypothetical protein